MNVDEIKAQWLTLCEWIDEAHGTEVANLWLWTCTPYPAGPPSQKQMDDGLALAAGEIEFETLRRRVDDEMWQAFNTFVEANPEYGCQK